MATNTHLSVMAQTGVPEMRKSAAILQALFPRHETNEALAAKYETSPEYVGTIREHLANLNAYLQTFEGTY